MHIDASTPSPVQLTESTDRQACAAQHAVQAEAMAENLRQLTSIAAWANRAQQVEHIRSLVAITMAHLSVHASPATRENATHWQTWALGVADGIETPPQNA